MGQLAEKAPLKGLQHIKRIRKTSEPGSVPRLEILLCTTQPHEGASLATTASPDKPELLPERLYAPLPEPIAALVAEHKLSMPRIHMIAEHAPGTREQWAEWTQYWPMSWTPPDAKTAEPQIELSQNARLAMQKWMRLALAQADCAQQQGSSPNAAVIVNPATDRVLAVGLDGTAEHPLHHATMRAVSAAAADNRAAWPDTPGGGSGGPSAQELSHSSHASAHTPELDWPPGDLMHRAPRESGAEKRQKQAGCTDVSQGLDLTARIDASQGTEEAIQPPGERPYLCTGYDCYVVQEPCAMCAMALVHSRLRRVIFCKPDAQHGALGGSFKLHAERSLNHHYIVFQLPLRCESHVV